MSRAVSYSRFGGPEVLEIIDVAMPVPRESQVRVAVRAAGLNAYDFKVRSIPGYLRSLTLPTGQGSEFAGVVDVVGAGVTSPAVGDEVLGWSSFSAQADFVIVPASHLAVKPAPLDWATAGGIGAAGNTAERSVSALGAGQADTVLVSAAAGGVGLIAAQLLLRAGATVIGTASETNHDFLRSLGVIPVSYGPGLVERVRAVAPNGVTAALDNAGEETVMAALELGVPAAKINSIVWYNGAARFGFTTVGGGGKTASALAALAELVAAGEILVPIAATFPLTEVRAAYELLEGRHLRGKVVLTLP